MSDELSELTELADAVEEEHDLSRFEGYLGVIERRLVLVVEMAGRVADVSAYDPEVVFVDTWRRALTVCWPPSDDDNTSSLLDWARSNGFMDGDDSDD